MQKNLSLYEMHRIVTPICKPLGNIYRTLSFICTEVWCFVMGLVLYQKHCLYLSQSERVYFSLCGDLCVRSKSYMLKKKREKVKLHDCNLWCCVLLLFFIEICALILLNHSYSQNRHEHTDILISLRTHKSDYTYTNWNMYMWIKILRYAHILCTCHFFIQLCVNPLEHHSGKGRDSGCWLHSRRERKWDGEREKQTSAVTESENRRKLSRWELVNNSK